MLTHRWSKFQSTRHTGRDDLPTSGWVRGSNFNPRATRGATSVFAKVNKSIFRFQSTRHTGRDWLLSLFYACFQHFNPRATRGATGRGFIYFAVGFISIHAPHGARLFKAYCLQDVVAISIHAPHGARLYPSILDARSAAISIHAPHGARPSIISIIHAPKTISIHAPHGARQQKSATISETLRYR